MGYSTKQIDKTPGMALQPDEASHPEHLDRVVTVDEFDNGTAKVHRIIETGQLYVERDMVPGMPVREFIKGEEV